MNEGAFCVVPIDERLRRHAQGFDALWKVIRGYCLYVAMNDLSSTLLGIEMGRAEFLAVRLLSYDEHLIGVATTEIAYRIDAENIRFYRPDLSLPVLAVDRPGVRFAVEGGGYVGPDEPDHEQDIGAAEAGMRYIQ